MSIPGSKAEPPYIAGTSSSVCTVTSWSSDFVSPESEPFSVSAGLRSPLLSATTVQHCLGLGLQIALFVKLLCDGQLMIYFLNSDCGRPTLNSQWWSGV